MVAPQDSPSRDDILELGQNENVFTKHISMYDSDYFQVSNETNATVELLQYCKKPMRNKFTRSDGTQYRS